MGGYYVRLLMCIGVWNVIWKCGVEPVKPSKEEDEDADGGFLRLVLPSETVWLKLFRIDWRFLGPLEFVSIKLTEQRLEKGHMCWTDQPKTLLMSDLKGLW